MHRLLFKVSRLNSQINFLSEFKNFKKDASNGLSYDKMVYHIDKTHPRIICLSKKSKEKVFLFIQIDGELKFKKHQICGTSTGNNCCLKSCRKSDLSQYGPGIVIYFQFVKFLIYIGVFLTLLSLPAFILYQSGSLITNKQNPDLTDLFSSFTLGNIG